MNRRRSGFESLAGCCHPRHPGHPFSRALVRLLHLDRLLARPRSRCGRRSAHRDARPGFQFRRRLAALVPLFQSRRPTSFIGSRPSGSAFSIFSSGHRSSFGWRGLRFEFSHLAANPGAFRPLAGRRSSTHRRARRSLRPHQCAHHSHPPSSGADFQIFPRPGVDAAPF